MTSETPPPGFNIWTALQSAVLALLGWVLLSVHGNRTDIAVIATKVEAIAHNRELVHIERRIQAIEDRIVNITARIRELERMKGERLATERTD